MLIDEAVVVGVYDSDGVVKPVLVVLRCCRAGLWVGER